MGNTTALPALKKRKPGRPKGSRSGKRITLAKRLWAAEIARDRVLREALSWAIAIDPKNTKEAAKQLRKRLRQKGLAARAGVSREMVRRYANDSAAMALLAEALIPERKAWASEIAMRARADDTPPSVRRITLSRANEAVGIQALRRVHDRAVEAWNVERDSILNRAARAGIMAPDLPPRPQYLGLVVTKNGARTWATFENAVALFNHYATQAERDPARLTFCIYDDE